MNDRDDDLDARRLSLSRLLDGDADSGDAQAACGAFRGDARTRADWHAYHLIGDLVRSSELVRSPAHDAAFLAGLRERLAREPAVLAPTPLPTAASTPRRRNAWLAPAAVAAGFAAVAAVLVVTRVAAPGSEDRMALAAGTRAPVVAAVAASALPQANVDALLVRNAELDRYLAAHRQYTQSGALATPAGLVRSATVAVPGR